MMTLFARRSFLRCVLVGAAAMWVAAGCGGSQVKKTPTHASFEIQSAVMGEARRINVYLPPASRRTGPAPRYPVVYMPDGGLAEDFPHVAATIDAGIHERRMAPVILVGIENTQRRRDMTGPTEVESDRKIAAVVGGSAAFRDFIARELIPAIDSRYPNDGNRAIIGESLAGLFILETFFQTPELFDTYIALDPSLWWNNGSLASGAATWLTTHPHASARLYVAWAEREMIGPHIQRLEGALSASAPPGLKWQVVPRTDLDHSTIYRTLAPIVLPAMYPPQ